MFSMTFVGSFRFTFGIPGLLRGEAGLFDCSVIGEIPVSSVYDMIATRQFILRFKGFNYHCPGTWPGRNIERSVGKTAGHKHIDNGVYFIQDINVSIYDIKEANSKSPSQNTSNTILVFQQLISFLPRQQP